MLRFRRLSAVSRHHRLYTPICQPEASTDHIVQLRNEDERRTLWSQSIPIPSVGAAVEAWIRFGNDPVLHTSFPALHGGQIKAAKGASSLSNSPFAYVEDYFGTNMVFGTPEHVRESAALWASYFERRFASRIRQSRRTAANHIGLVNAPDVFTDEADRPETKWSQDTQFRECAYLAEKFLKEKVSNLEQFERALRRATPETYLAFFNVFQQQTQTQIPLPSPSVWHYEGERRKQWVDKFIPVSHESQRFFAEVIAADLKKLHGAQEKLLQTVGAVFSEVGKIMVRRHQRRLAGRQWTALTETEKETLCGNAVRRWARQVEEDEFDPPEFDADESSEEWNAEHASITEHMSSRMEGLSFTALDFWRHVIRCEELETEHIHAEERIRSISAAALKELYNTTPMESIVQGLVESIARGQLDVPAAIFKPFSNDIWCKLHYAKFGASTITQHTTTASRELLFFHASSPQEVAATATLYYATKPLSSALDYSSPYKFRRSFLTLCSTYGLEMSHAIQRPHLLSCAHLARGEDLMRAIVVETARPFGVRRRAAMAQQQAESRRLVAPMEHVMVSETTPELLESGADPSNNELTAQQVPVKMWPLGARRKISYKWSTPHLQSLQTALAASGGSSTALTAQQVQEIADIRRRAFLEVSLWRRVSSAEMQQRKESKAKSVQDVAEAIKSVPQLDEVRQYAKSFFERITGEAGVSNTDTSSSGGGSVETDDTWEFAVMLDDRAALNAEEAMELYLPFRDADGVTLLPGEYRVRIRGVDLELNPTQSSHLCSEGFSEPIQVFDGIPQLIQQFFRTDTSDTNTETSITHIPAENFIAFCHFLRQAGLDVPLYCEFQAGQALTADGDVYMDHFLHLLRGDKFHRSCAQSGLTDVQHRIEPFCRAHWEVHHPGANAAEWAEARRRVLDHAMTEERDWWFPNDMLDVHDISTGSTNGFSFAVYPATVRYGVELCTALPADGHAASKSPNALSVTCSVDGTGAATSLTFHGNESNTTPTTRADIDIDEALGVARQALQRAHDRHNTLSAFRLGPLEKQAQVMTFCGVHGMEFGGKYARTYVYAFEKAKAELAEMAISGRVVPGVEEDDVARVSDTQSVDRFASTTHPEQRKTRFATRVGPGAVPIEDPTADQKSTWGR